MPRGSLNLSYSSLSGQVYSNYCLYANVMILHKYINKNITKNIKLTGIYFARWSESFIQSFKILAGYTTTKNFAPNEDSCVFLLACNLKFLKLIIMIWSLPIYLSWLHCGITWVTSSLTCFISTFWSFFRLILSGCDCFTFFKACRPTKPNQNYQRNEEDSWIMSDNLRFITYR